MGESTHYPIKNLINKGAGELFWARFFGATAPKNHAAKVPLGDGSSDLIYEGLR